MAELVDAADSKSAVRKDVQVRFLFWAPKSQNEIESESNHEVLTFFFTLLLFLILMYISLSNLPKSWKQSAPKSQKEIESESNHEVLTFFFTLLLFLILMYISLSNLPKSWKQSAPKSQKEIESESNHEVLTFFFTLLLFLILMYIRLSNLLYSRAFVFGSVSSLLNARIFFELLTGKTAISRSVITRDL